MSIVHLFIDLLSVYLFQKSTDYLTRLSAVLDRGLELEHSNNRDCKGLLSS